MVTVSIGGMSAPVEKTSEGWINQMIEDARRRGVALCIQVRAQTEGVDIILSTPACGQGGGGGRAPNDREQRIFDAWAKRGLSRGQFAPGDLRAFLNDLARLL